MHKVWPSLLNKEGMKWYELLSPFLESFFEPIFSLNMYAYIGLNASQIVLTSCLLVTLFWSNLEDNLDSRDHWEELN